MKYLALLSSFLKPLPLVITVSSIVFLILAVKGNVGTPIAFQDDIDSAVGSPFESTNSTSRYLLVQAMADNHSFFFTNEQARQAAPDLVKYQNRYFSLFTPGISMLAIPFYELGKLWGLPQLFTFASTLFFAILNMLLIAHLCQRLGFSKTSSWIAGFLFLFGTNAYAYALTLTQHHVAVTLILLGLINITKERSFFRNIALGIAYGFGILVDIPNAFLMLPIMFYAFFQHFEPVVTSTHFRLNLKLSVVGLAIGFLPLAASFAYYNYTLTGSLTKIGQFIGRYDYPDEISTEIALQNQVRLDEEEETEVKTKSSAKKGISLPFKTRNQIEGFHILLLSNERSWIYYSPILLLGLPGLYYLYKTQKSPLVVVLCSTILLNIVLYGMFGDPWGGWSFGARYLIPGAAVMAVGLAALLDFAHRSRWKKLIFASVALVGILSIKINSLGALTTAALPPKVEADQLAEPIPYTPDYNVQMLDKNLSSSLIFNQYLRRDMNAHEYYTLAWISISAIYLLLLIIALRSKPQTTHATTTA